MRQQECIRTTGKDQLPAARPLSQLLLYKQFTGTFLVRT